MSGDSSYRPQVYRQRGGSILTVATGGQVQIDGGTLDVATGTGGAININAGGSLTVSTGAKFAHGVRSATADLTLDGSDSGVMVSVKVADLLHTLPNSTGNAGINYTFAVATSGLSSAGGATLGGLKIKSQASDKIVGNGLAVATDNILVLLPTSDQIGDFVEVKSDGGGLWHIVGAEGDWAMTTATN